MKNKKFVTIGAYIPLGMCRSAEPESVSENRHPVRDASLTGCRNVASRRFLPSDVFLTEYVSDKLTMMPTKMIETKAQYEAIMARVNELVEIVDDNTPQNDKNYVELDFLADLVVDYEKEMYPIGKISFAQTLVSTASVEKELVNF